jgi:hypothetical protein
VAISEKITRIHGELECDYVRNRVTFTPDGDKPFQLPLDPLDIEIVRTLNEYAKRKTEVSAIRFGSVDGRGAGCLSYTQT